MGYRPTFPAFQQCIATIILNPYMMVWVLFPVLLRGAPVCPVSLAAFL